MTILLRRLPFDLASREAVANPGRARDRPRVADRLLGGATRAFAGHDYRAAYAFADGAYQQVVLAVKGAGVDPAGVATARRAAAEAARRTVDLHSPHEFIDTLAPGSPRSQP